MGRYFLVLLLGLAGLAGCAVAQKDYGSMTEREYQNRPKLSQALVSGSEPLSETAIHKILSSKVSFPKSIQLAVVRLADAQAGLEFQTIDNSVTDHFYNKSNWGERVKSVIPMPQVMVAQPCTLSSLRQAAVLLQADALLIVKPVSYGDWKFQLFENKAKGITTLEVLLLDTRTSIVPYTATITETAELEREKSDYSNYELMARAKKASEEQALAKIAPEIKKFILKAM